MKDAESELVEVVGEEAAIALADRFGGTRLYIPAKIREDHRIARAIGRKAAGKLCAYYSPVTIRVPILRKLRAVRYRAEGLSDAKIARLLGITENGVGRLFKRVREASEGATETV